MRKYSRYEKYKLSNIDWLGEIPEHWNDCGLTHRMESIVDYRGKTPEKVDSGIFLITAKNIKDGYIDYDASQEFVREEDYFEIMQRGLPCIGDILMTTEAPLGNIAQVDNTNVALAQRIIKFSARKDSFQNHFLYYQLRSSFFKSQLEKFATGSTALGIKAERFCYLKLLYPPLLEQQKIADFLDRETAKIDSLIKKRNDLIKLLQEKRSAVISHAVTKGIDPTVRLKPSNIDWLGEIPEHWEIRKLKYSFMLKTQKATGARIPVALENIESWTGKYLPSESEFEGDGIAFESHDILFGKLRPYLAKVWAAEFAGEAIGDFFVLHPLKHMNSRFAAYYMRTSDFINLIDGSTFGSKMPRASWDFFSSTPINLPPLSEQQIAPLP